MTDQTELTISTKEQRDEILKQAEYSREQGNLEEALTQLEKIKEWDSQNFSDNPKRSAVFGHIRITYSRMALHEPNLENKIEFLRLAKKSAEEGLEVLTSLPQDAGLLATMQIHLASANSELSDFLEDTERVQTLNSALETIEQAIQNLPGSQAHKAWPLRLKTEIFRKLRRFEDATKTALYAQELLFAGYNEEVEKDAQAAALKIRVWLSGLQLQQAYIALDQNMPILAQYYANTVLTTPDETGALTERKKEAQEILDKLI
jgi:tetratricopeptide (TPR) repeat protein